MANPLINLNKPLSKYAIMLLNAPKIIPKLNVGINSVLMDTFPVVFPIYFLFIHSCI